MNILFLTLLDFDSINERNLYTDLLREMNGRGHNIYVVSPTERRKKENTHIIDEAGIKILKLRIGNTQKTNAIEKGISTIRIETQVRRGIKRYFCDVIFDLVLYSTPPITLLKAVKYVKTRDKAFSYLMLKDIFPQNAIDLEMLSKKGIKGLIYRYFRNKEIALYAISDKIGCMSQANLDYVLDHNTLCAEKVEVCPNSVEVLPKGVSDRFAIRKKYGIPSDKLVFVYGGNLGKPQGIEHFINCIKAVSENEKIFFVIVGDGTEYNKVALEEKEHSSTLTLIKRLPKDEYDLLVSACDVGMICLDYRFTIPNFPSRLLGYMQAAKPVYAITDLATDIGDVIKEGKFGWWSPSNDIAHFENTIDRICSLSSETIEHMGDSAFEYLKAEYSVKKQADLILNAVRGSDEASRNK